MPPRDCSWLGRQQGQVQSWCCRGQDNAHVGIVEQRGWRGSGERCNSMLLPCWWERRKEGTIVRLQQGRLRWLGRLGRLRGPATTRLHLASMAWAQHV
eukprot:1159783-Pelagomonas_calceolata.AAC.12